MALSTCCFGRRAQRCPEHGDRRDERQSDHQGGGGLRRPSRVAHRVLAPEPPWHAAQRRQRTPDRARQRSRQQRHKQGHGDKDRQRADTHQQDRRLSQPDEHGGDGDGGDRRTGADPPRQRSRPWFAAADERRYRRDRHRATGWEDRREHRDPGADGERHDRSAGLEHERAGRQHDPERLQQCLETDRGRHSQAETDRGRHQSGQGRLSEHRPEHLSSARPDQAQQRQLAGPLADGDRERVEDREGADEQGDRREDQQRRRDERERVVDRGRQLVGDGLATDDLHPGRQQLGDRPLQLDVVSAGRGEHVDRVVAPGRIEQALRGRQVEAGQRDAGQVVITAERHDSRDRERLRPVGQVDQHPVSDREVVFGGRRLVHHDIVGRRRSVALDQPVRGQLRIRIEREPQRRAPAASDRVAVAGHELRVATHRPMHVLHSGQPADGHGDRLWNRPAVGSAVDGRGVSALVELLHCRGSAS